MYYRLLYSHAMNSLFTRGGIYRPIPMYAYPHPTLPLIILGHPVRSHARHKLFLKCTVKFETL